MVLGFSITPVHWVGDDFELLSISFSDLGSSCCCNLCSMDVTLYLALGHIVGWIVSQEGGLISDFDVLWFVIGLCILVVFLLSFGFVVSWGILLDLVLVLSFDMGDAPNFVAFMKSSASPLASRPLGSLLCCVCQPIACIDDNHVC